MHSSNYNCLQKETAPTFQDKRNVMTIEHFKTINVSRANSFTNEKCFGIENGPNVDPSQPREVHEEIIEREDANKQSKDLDYSQIRYDNPSFHTTCLNQMGEDIKFCSNALKTNFLSNLGQSKAFDKATTNTGEKADTSARRFIECPARFLKDPLKFHENREINGLQPSLKKSLKLLNIPILKSTLENPVKTEMKPMIALPDPILYNTFPRPMGFSSRNEFLFTSTPKVLGTFCNSADNQKALNTVCSNRISDIDKINYDTYKARTNRNLTKGIENITNKMNISKTDHEKYTIADSSNAKENNIRTFSTKKPIHLFQDVWTLTSSNEVRNVIETDQFKHTVCTNRVDDPKTYNEKHKIEEHSDINVADTYTYKINESANLFQNVGILAAPDMNRNSVIQPRNTVYTNKIDNYKTDRIKDRREEEKPINLFQGTIIPSTNRDSIENRYENTVCTNRMDKVSRSRRSQHEKHKMAENYVYKTNKSMNMFKDLATLTTPDVNSELIDNTARPNSLTNIHEIPEASQINKFMHQRTVDFCTNATCDRNKCSSEQQVERLASSAKSTYCVSTRIKKAFHTCEYENKCISTIDSALDVLQSILREVKRCREKNAAKYQLQKIKRKNENCEDERDSSETLRPECMQVLKEIKEHTGRLEEHLLIMSRSMNIKRKGNDKTMPVCQCCCVRTHQKKDIITQTPEKNNMFVQEPSTDFQKVENDYDFKTTDEVPQQEMDRESKREEAIEEENDKAIDITPMKNKDYSKEVKTVQIESVETDMSTLPTFDLLNLPIASSTPGKQDQLEIVNNVCYKSTCAQAVVSNENLRVAQAKRITSNELTIYPADKQDKAVNVESEEEISDESATVIFLVTVNSKCLKSKYKRSEFLNFRPRSAIDSCIVCHQKLVKCRPLSRRQMQVPIVFRVPSMRCKTDSESEEVDDERLTNARNVKCSCNASDLGNTVCTQSSSSRITAATSVPYVKANPNKENIARRREGCILS